MKRIIIMIKKVKGGYVIVHCTGPNKGKRVKATKTPVSRKKALAIHAAIQANKK
jgi:hypothetical protein